MCLRVGRDGGIFFLCYYCGYFSFLSFFQEPHIVFGAAEEREVCPWFVLEGAFFFVSSPKVSVM